MMLRRGKIRLSIAALFTAGAMVGTAVQRQSTGSPKEVVSSKEKRVKAGEEYTKKLLLLMDTDKNGKVSKQEFMSFMDKIKAGERSLALGQLISIRGGSASVVVPRKAPPTQVLEAMPPA